MTMDLKTALKRCTRLSNMKPDPQRAEWIPWQRSDAEALTVVIAAARENHAATLVAEVNATTAKVLEMMRPHEYRPGRHPMPNNCAACGEVKGAPIHQQPQEQP